MNIGVIHSAPSGRNVALKQDTRQSSTHYKWFSSNAVDGSVGLPDNITDQTRTCTHTSDMDTGVNHYWQIRFRTPVEFTRVDIHNRINHLSGDPRLSGTPSVQGAGGGARTRDRSIPADIRADLLANMPPKPPYYRLTLPTFRRIHSTVFHKDKLYHLSDGSTLPSTDGSTLPSADGSTLPSTDGSTLPSTNGSDG
ncbi:hypothetical protein PoB_006056400 [Plakobranchus ocellatus]|uniref:Uncharacterized protein n=1 Tax=Plakobranchus ocellatus TaxID=259542 RepID=A0AAV4CQB9_9GAST|nr:hypothetical protein PoB_006056400 [Plakobranchus ocellatus]